MLLPESSCPQTTRNLSQEQTSTRTASTDSPDPGKAPEPPPTLTRHRRSVKSKAPPPRQLPAPTPPALPPASPSQTKITPGRAGSTGLAARRGPAPASPLPPKDTSTNTSALGWLLRMQRGAARRGGGRRKERPKKGEKELRGPGPSPAPPPLRNPGAAGCGSQGDVGGQALPSAPLPPPGTTGRPPPHLPGHREGPPAPSSPVRQPPAQPRCPHLPPGPPRPAAARPAPPGPARSSPNFFFPFSVFRCPQSDAGGR